MPKGPLARASHFWRVSHEGALRRGATKGRYEGSLRRGNNWEPEEHILDRRLISKFDRKRKAESSTATLHPGAPRVEPTRPLIEVAADAEEDHAPARPLYNLAERGTHMFHRVCLCSALHVLCTYTLAYVVNAIHMFCCTSTTQPSCRVCSCSRCVASDSTSVCSRVDSISIFS